MLKHSDWNASWAKCPSKKFNTLNTLNGGYSGAERERSNEIIGINCHHLNDDDKYSGWGNINSNA